MSWVGKVLACVMILVVFTTLELICALRLMSVHFTN